MSQNVLGLIHRFMQELMKRTNARGLVVTVIPDHKDATTARVRVLAAESFVLAPDADLRNVPEWLRGAADSFASRLKTEPPKPPNQN